MPVMVTSEMVEPGTRALLGAVDVDGGQADHLSMAGWALEDVRAHFCVPPTERKE